MLLVLLGTMRAEIRRNDRGGIGSFKMAEFWFNNMTRYMDLLLETQRELAVEITQVSASRTGPWRSLRWVCREPGRGDHSGGCVENWVVEITQVSASRTGPWRSLR